VDPVKPAAGDPLPHTSITEAKLAQLGKGDNSMLPMRERRKPSLAPKPPAPRDEFRAIESRFSALGGDAERFTSWTCSNKTHECQD
jgi:hypothetical protein